MLSVFIPMESYPTTVDDSKFLTKANTCTVWPSYSLIRRYLRDLFFIFKLIVSVPLKHGVSCPVALWSREDKWNSTHVRIEIRFIPCLRRSSRAYSVKSASHSAPGPTHLEGDYFTIPLCCITVKSQAEVCAYGLLYCPIGKRVRSRIIRSQRILWGLNFPCKLSRKAAFWANCSIVLRIRASHASMVNLLHDRRIITKLKSRKRRYFSAYRFIEALSLRWGVDLLVLE